MLRAEGDKQEASLQTGLSRFPRTGAGLQSGTLAVPSAFLETLLLHHPATDWNVGGIRETLWQIDLASSLSSPVT